MSIEQASAPVIEMEGVHKFFQMGQHQVHAVCDINLRIEPGEFVAIVGPSGSGKTTLLNLIGCLDLPSEGSYRWRGRDVTTLNDAQLSRLRGESIGFIFQDYSLLPRLSALRNVELPRYYATGRGDRKRAQELLAQVGLAERAHHRPVELSGGEQQRVAVARALMNKPTLLLADEPTGNLDSVSGQELIHLLKRLNEEQGLTLVVVSHDPSVSGQARRILRMRDGAVVSEQG